MKKQNRLFLKGFTLIELLVVISIIGFITTIVIVSLNSAREKGKETAGIQQLKQVKNAINMFFSDNGYYPDVISPYLNSLQLSLSSPKVYITKIAPNTQLLYATSSCVTSKCSGYSLTLWDSKDSGTMSWYSAVDYCAKKGKRLPTPAEYAAQSTWGIPVGGFVTGSLYWTSTEIDASNSYTVTKLATTFNTAAPTLKTTTTIVARCVKE